MGNTTRTRITFHKLSLAACLSALPAKAFAEEDRPASTAPKPPPFSKGSQWVVALDQLAAVGYERSPREKHSTPASESGPATTTVREGSQTAFTVLRPAVGVDFFPVSHLSVGLGATYDQVSWTSETHAEGGLAALAGSTKVDQTNRMVTLKPRIGAAYTWPSGLGVWGRADLSWLNAWANATTRMDVWQSNSHHWGALSAGVQALGTYTPTPHVVLMAGPGLSKRLASWSTADTPDAPDASDYPVSVGFAVGGGAYF